MKSLRQNLYFLNLLLAVEFLLVLFFVMLIKKGAKIKKIQGDVSKEVSKPFRPLVAAKVPLGQVSGKRDVFGLGQSANVIEQEKNVPTVSIPQLVIPEITAAPAAPVVDFVDPLTITLNGIVGSSVPELSVCIIADETEKENTYRVGDRVKDGVIIKILRDRVVILRLNGQIETFYLHEINPLLHVYDVSSIVSLVTDNKYKIDTDKFKQKVVNLGAMLDHFDMVPFVGGDGKVVGIVVTDKDPKSLAVALGFKENDLILSIDDVSLKTHKDRMLAYDKIVAKKEDSEFSVEFEREGKLLKNSYILSSKQVRPGISIVPVANKPAIASVVNSSSTGSAILFPELIGAEERKTTNNMYKENIDRIRQEMLANLQTRAS